MISNLWQIDTMAAEYPAKTNYLYYTYNGMVSDCALFILYVRWLDWVAILNLWDSYSRMQMTISSHNIFFFSIQVFVQQRAKICLLVMWTFEILKPEQIKFNSCWNIDPWNFGGKAVLVLLDVLFHSATINTQRDQ